MNAAAIVLFGFLLVLVRAGFVEAQEAPYKGKTVRVLVGFPSGGGSDAEGRVLARHIARYIPGNRTLIVQNMPGAGGLSASNWFEVIRMVSRPSWRAASFLSRVVRRVDVCNK